MLRADIVASETVGFLFAECDDIGNSGAELIVHVIHLCSRMFFRLQIYNYCGNIPYSFIYDYKYRARTLRINVKQTKKCEELLNKAEGVVSKS
jgi:hypothetical protein